jgi:hypothetical protein
METLESALHGNETMLRVRTVRSANVCFMNVAAFGESIARQSAVGGWIRERHRAMQAAAELGGGPELNYPPRGGMHE